MEIQDIIGWLKLIMHCANIYVICICRRAYDQLNLVNKCLTHGKGKILSGIKVQKYPSYRRNISWWKLFVENTAFSRLRTNYILYISMALIPLSTVYCIYRFTNIVKITKTYRPDSFLLYLHCSYDGSNVCLNLQMLK
jgi:hypothetical protein